MRAYEKNVRRTAGLPTRVPYVQEYLQHTDVSYPALKGRASCFNDQTRSPCGRVTVVSVSTGVNSPRTAGTRREFLALALKAFAIPRGFGNCIMWPTNYMRAMAPMEPTYLMRAKGMVKPRTATRASLVMKPIPHMRAKNAMKPTLHMRASGQVKPPCIMRATRLMKPGEPMRAMTSMEPIYTMRAYEIMWSTNYMRAIHGYGTRGGYASQILHETHEKHASRSRCAPPCSYASHSLYAPRFVHASHPCDEAHCPYASRKESGVQACHASHRNDEAQSAHACWEGGEAATPLPSSLPPPFSYPRGGATSTRCGGGNCSVWSRLRAPIGGKKWRKKT